MTRATNTPQWSVMATIAVLVFVGMVLSWALGCPSPAEAQQRVVFVEALTDVSTANQCSAVLQNVGQSTHLVHVVFPDENSTVSSLDVQLQYNEDPANLNWKLAGAPIIEAPVLNEGDGQTKVYAFATYFGVFRALRVCSVAATPGGEEMTVYYTGTINQGSPLSLLEPGDRWVF